MTALFNDYVDRWERILEMPDHRAFSEVIRFMRIKMELRRSIMEIALASPVECLQMLREEYANIK